jgi:hypothetical protein
MTSLPSTIRNFSQSLFTAPSKSALYVDYIASLRRKKVPACFVSFNSGKPAKDLLQEKTAICTLKLDAYFAAQCI